MSLLFELPHIFVVFPPGAGGNFISGVLTRTISREFTNLALSGTGNAHSNSTSKLEFSDVMSCGLIYGTLKFQSFEEKLEYYKKEIQEKHGNDTDVKISWSHDFSNIPLYKQLFPNCKILVVTQDTNREKLTVLIQQELKNRLDPNGFVFLKNKDTESGFKYWKEGLRHVLISILGQDYIDLATEISNNYMDPKYKPMITFVAIIIIISLYDQEYLIDPGKKMNFDYLNYCTISRFIEDPGLTYSRNFYTLFTVGPSFKDCLTDDCIVMPYSVLMDKNLKEFISMLEKFVGTTLDSSQLEFVQHNFEEYYTKQSQGLMENPNKFFHQVRMSAMQQIESLKNNKSYKI